MENKKNTQANVKKNSRIKLQIDLPPRGRQNWAVKGNQMQKGSYSQKQPVGKDNIHHSAVENVPFLEDSRSHPTLSNDDFYNTLEMICHEKVEQPLEFSLKNRTSNNLF